MPRTSPHLSGDVAVTSLEIKDLRVDFPGVVAVDGLSLKISSGEVWGLIGPNGAGKTTTMRAAVGLQDRTHGTVQIGDFDLEQHPDELRQKVGYMPDFFPVYDHLTVAEYLDHYARAYFVLERDAAIERCLLRSRLLDKRNELCEGLSRGMRQRLLLAKTLIHDPPVLILDEPASGLDPIGRIELRETLAHLRSEGKAVLVSSHILAEMTEFCTHVAIMEKGRMVTAGSVSDLAARRVRIRMLVRWRMPHPSVEDLLAQTAGVTHVRLVGLEAVFEFSGGEEDLDRLLHRLVEAGVRVTEWRTEKDALETIFLESGARALS